METRPEVDFRGILIRLSLDFEIISADIEQILLDLIGGRPEYSSETDRFHIWKTPYMPIVT